MGPTPRTSNEALARIQDAVGTVTRRARDTRLHERLGLRAGVELDGPHFSTLARVHHSPGLTLSALADAVGLEISTLSRRVKALEARGWVQRTANGTDGRSFHISLTDEGEKVFDALGEGWQHMLAEVLDQWEPAEVDQLAHLLERFAADFERFANPPPRR